MILFGHLGIPLAATQLYMKNSTRPSHTHFIRFMDYRIFFAGALFPDIIDKSSSIILGKILGTTQSFGHTMVFAAAVFFMGLIQNRKYNKSAILVLAAGIFSHHLLDLVTMNYKNFLWPAYGLKFIPSEHFETNLIKKVIRALSFPYYLAGEIIGFPFFAYYFFKIFREKRFLQFMKTGRLSD